MSEIAMTFQDSEPKSAVDKETGMVLQLADGTIQACDRVVEDLLGYSAKQLIGRTSLGLTIHPDGSAFTTGDDPAIVALDSCQPCLNRVLGFYKPDGTLVWLCLNSTPLFQVNATTPYAVVTTLRQEERPEIEAELHDKVDDRVTTILESMSDAFVALDRDWRITYMNQKAVQLTGLTLAETLGKTHWEVWSWSVGKVPEQQYRRAMTEQVSVHFEVLYEPDTIWYDIHAYPSEAGLAIYFRNINESKQIEEALYRSNAVLNTISETTPTLLAVKDRQGRFIFANSAICCLVNKPIAEVIGKTDLDLHSKVEQARQIMANDRLIMETGQVQTFEEAGDFDNENIFLSIKSPYFDEQGNIIGVIVVAVEITERKRMEAALRESEQRFRAIQELAIDGFILLRSIRNELGTIEDFEWTYANPKGAELMGRSVEALVGKRLLTVVPGNKTKVFDTYVQVAETGQPSDIELFYEADGITGWFRIVTIKIDDGVAISFSDISDRKQAEQELQESEEKLNLFVRYAPASVAMFDLNMQYLAVSQQWVHIYSLGSIESVLGRSHYDVFPSVPERWRQAHQRGLSGEIIKCDEDEFILADGSQQWLRWEIRPWREGAGAIGGILIFVEDISDRRQIEVALRDSEARYRTLAQAIPQFVFITNTEGQNEYVNQQFCDYTGLNIEQMLNLDWLTILHPLDAQRTSDRWMASVRTGDFYEIEYRFRRADGEYRWFLGQGTPLKDEQGNIVQWFGTCTDINDRKQLEAERVLLFEQERASRQEAETANRLKDEFLAVLSHELRSPLNPILGWANLLQSRRLDEAKTMEALASIERNAKLQAQLIEDLLDISRIMHGKLMLNATPVSLVFVITAALETVRLAIEAKSIHLEVTLEPNVKVVFGDVGRLQQVVWNLLSNAVKFTPASGQVKVHLMQVGDCAQIQVMDTGKGINPEFLPFVFEYFRQEDGSTTRKFGGLGLGLAIARQIVELHGGQIWADSLGEGQGATFTVQFPLYTD
ncbi:MAG: PAS domain S-box protein [Cyanomargarita calcarea GSE-NOS-MK-12-04C]|jgi:PAS domain S-box-containing protein|uniref:Circadian input-output histidine kinase CikA n=1 Tax=Cyanomargarita calcarea GSE-NOS-MK-12-04C TaxID=2839659 RepID=A0A951QT61_9CYAN|nr:PAS domain S-box protein [Cyanomargarita calcarea GSE-NOS-MK-12-04C]